jgi:small subunit ribosomal protein S20
MAHHQSAKKRIRQTKARNMYNRYYSKTTRNAIRRFKTIGEKNEAQDKLPTIISSLDKLVKRGIIHKNKAANIKSKLTKKVNKL